MTMTNLLQLLVVLMSSTPYKEKQSSGDLKRTSYALDMERVVNYERMHVDPKISRTLDPYRTCMVNSCQGKITRILFKLNTQFIDMVGHWHTSYCGRKYFQSN